MNIVLAVILLSCNYSWFDFFCVRLPWRCGFLTLEESFSEQQQ